jgi:hypothetical protein
VLDTTRIERALGSAPRHFREALDEFIENETDAGARGS